MKFCKGKISNWLVGLLAVILLGLSVYFLQKFAPAFLEELGVRVRQGTGKIAAPDFVLNDVNGNVFRLIDFRGKIMVLNFWTSWNEKSLEQLKTLQNYSKLVSPTNIVIFAINSQEPSSTAKIVAIRERLDIPILLDTQGEVGELYQIGILPLTIFIDRTGIEMTRIVGPFTLSDIQKQVTVLR